MSLNRAYGRFLEQVVQYNHSGVVTSGPMEVLDAVTVRIPPLTGVIVDRTLDRSDPEVTHISTIQTDHIVTGGGDQIVLVYVTKAGDFRYSTDFLAVSSITDELFMGKIVMNAGVVVTTVDTPIAAYSGTVDHLSELINQGGHKVRGSILSASAGSDLTLAVTEGDHNQLGRAFLTSPNSPNQCDSPADAIVGATAANGRLYLGYITAAGDRAIDSIAPGANPAIDPDRYNLNGVLTAQPTNNYVALRFIQFCVTNNIIAFYGTATYANLAAAEAGYLNEEPEPLASLDGSWIGTLIVKESTTNLVTAVAGGNAKFIDRKGGRD